MINDRLCGKEKKCPSCLNINETNKAKPICDKDGTKLYETGLAVKCDCFNKGTSNDRK